jgi:hypothetical protein
MSDIGLDVMLDDATCGTCATFASGWGAGRWNCRRGSAYVNGSSAACNKWHPRQPQSAIHPEDLRRAASALDGVMSEMALVGPGGEILPRPRRPSGLRGSTDGVVYFLDCGSMTKIGHTYQQIDRRIKGIETHNPFELTLWGLLPGGVQHEASWHTAFARFRHRGEWFLLNDDARKEIKLAIARDGGELYE